MIEFQLLDIWSKFLRKVMYSITHRLARAVKKVAKLNIVFTAGRLVGSWKKPILQHVLCRISHILPGRTWWQTSHVAGGCVPTGPGHPLCLRLTH